jgi:hypothetical protein
MYARAGMYRGIGFLECAPSFDFIGGLILHTDTMCRTEPGMVTINRKNVFVSGNCPKARPVTAVDPADRTLLAQPLEGCVRYALGISVVGGDVGIRITRYCHV